MQICHLIYDDIANPWLAGGGAVRAREIYRRLSSRHQISLISGRYPGAPAEEELHGLRVLRVGSDRSYARSRLAYMRQAPRALMSLQWDVWVHEFSAFAPLRVPRAVRRRGILLFQHFVGHHAIIKHPLAGPFAWLAERLALRGYPQIIAVSESVGERIRRLAGPGVQVDCVHNGVDPRYFQIQPAEKPWLLYLGRTDIHTKGLDLLVPAFAELAADYPRMRLKLAGRGSERQRESLSRLVDRYHLAGRVDLLGEVSEAEKSSLLASCMCVCMPSRYEGWGIVAIEAAAASRPVLGTRIPGLRDAIRDGETGILVRPESVSALVAGLRLLIGDSDRRRRLGEAGRVWAGRFNWDRVAEEHAELCRRLAETHTREGPS